MASVADAEIDHLGVDAGLRIEPLDALGERLVERHAPADHERIADHGDAQLPGHALVGDLTVAQPLRVGAEIDAHQPRLMVGRVLVADQRIGGDLLDVARVCPHFEVELHAVVGDEPREQLDPDGGMTSETSRFDAIRRMMAAPAAARLGGGEFSRSARSPTLAQTYRQYRGMAAPMNLRRL